MKKIFTLIFTFVFTLTFGASDHKDYKVYDCFPFFNELDRLEVRLHELDSVVDYFVLVEATKNHQGKEKPLYFEENKHRFKRFLHKIIHVAVDFSEVDESTRDMWTLEVYQRNYIKRVLKKRRMCPRDVIFVSDLNEIPKALAVKKAVKILHNDRDVPLVFLSLKWFEIFFNGERLEIEKHSGHLVRSSWCRSYAGLWRYLKQPELTFTHIRREVSRKLHKRRDIAKIMNAGWHFTWTGGAKKLTEKVGGIAEGHGHTASQNEYTTEAFWDNLITEGKSWRSNQRIKIIPVDESFPKFIQDNLEDFIERELVAPCK